MQEVPPHLLVLHISQLYQYIIFYLTNLLLIDISIIPIFVLLQIMLGPLVIASVLLRESTRNRIFESEEKNLYILHHYFFKILHFIYYASEGTSLFAIS